MTGVKQVALTGEERTAIAVYVESPALVDVVERIIARRVSAATTPIEMLAERALRKGYDLDPEDVLNTIGGAR